LFASWEQAREACRDGREATWERAEEHTNEVFDYSLGALADRAMVRFRNPFANAQVTPHNSF
jgi:hypothetical protein